MARKEAVNFRARFPREFRIQAIEVVPARRIGIDLMLEALSCRSQGFDHPLHLDYAHVFVAGVAVNEKGYAQFVDVCDR